MPGLRVILNDRCLRNLQTGIGHYVSALIEGIRRQAPDVELLPFYSTYFGSRRPKGTVMTPVATAADVGGQRSSERPAFVAPVGAVEPDDEDYETSESQATFTQFRWPGWVRNLAQTTYEAAFEGIGKARGFTLYHEPNNIPCAWHGPIVTTVHDLSVLRHPEWHPADRVAWYRRDFAAALPRTTHFITVSEFTRREMTALLGVPASRITAIYNGVKPIFHPREADEVADWLAARGLPSVYLLFAGTLEPRKNLAGLIEAFARLPRGWRREFPLLVAGMPGWSREGVHELLRRHDVSEYVRVLGYVSEEELAWLYCGARALVWPSFYEGFGLPPLEAMASGTPVISSDASSIPEVVSDCGLLVDPHHTSEITAAMRRILEDDELAETLSRKGLARSRCFSWEISAAEHVQVYRHCIEAWQ